MQGPFKTGKIHLIEKSGEELEFSLRGNTRVYDSDNGMLIRMDILNNKILLKWRSS